MLAKKCDICGILYEAYDEKKNLESLANSIRFVNRNSEYGTFHEHPIQDLCPGCMDAIRQTIDNLRTHGNVRKKPVIDKDFQAKVEKVVKGVRVCSGMDTWDDCKPCPYFGVSNCACIHSQEILEVIEKFKEMVGYED
jgi:hypothetical protein